MNNNKRTREVWLTSKTSDFKESQDASELDKYEWKKGTEEADFELGADKLQAKRRKLNDDKVGNNIPLIYLVYVYILMLYSFSKVINLCIRIGV